LTKDNLNFEKMLPAIIDGMDAIMAVKDFAGRFIVVNKSFAEFVKAPPEALIGNTDFEFLPKEMAEKYRRDDVRVLKTLTPLTVEETLEDNEGEIRYLLTHKKPIRFENDGEYYLLLFAMDITRQKEAERAVRETDKRYRMLFDTMVSGFVLCDVVFDAHGRPEDLVYIEVNPAYEQMSGRKKEEYIGKTMRRDFPYMEEYLFDAYKKAAQTGKEVVIERYSPRVDSYFSILAFIPEKGRFAFITTDITQRKRMEDAIHTEKEYFRVTLQSLGDGVITTDVHQRVELMNTAAEKMTGWTQEEAKGKPFLEVFNIRSEDEAMPIQNPIEQALLTDSVSDLKNNALLTSRENIIRSVADSAAPIKDAQGHTTGVVMVFRDVTEKKLYDDNIQYLTYHDQLTGLYNRMYFERELGRIERALKKPVSVIMGDVNGLKLTNDLFGHAQGDALLRTIAGIIRQNCPAGSLAARWGGDEFLVCLSGTDEAAAERIIKNIHKTCGQNTETYLDQVILPSISMGSATDRDGSEGIYATIQKAENNMYKAKLLESRNIQSGIIHSIRSTLFEQNLEEQEHGQRMVHYCKLIGQQMNIPKIKLEELELAAVMHDVGMIAIPKSVLMKPGKLSEEEWQEIKRHPEMGYRIARSSAELTGIADYILYHHERWDGKGYPQGLKKNEIPLFSRILSVADAYDAMTHPRPYRKKLSPEEAAAEIKKDSGTLFDPEVVRALLGAFTEEMLQ